MKGSIRMISALRISWGGLEDLNKHLTLTVEGMIGIIYYLIICIFVFIFLVMPCTLWDFSSLMRH